MVMLTLDTCTAGPVRTDTGNPAPAGGGGGVPARLGGGVLTAHSAGPARLTVTVRGSFPVDTPTVGDGGAGS